MIVEVKAILYYLFTEMKYSLIIFWSIFLSSIILLFILSDLVLRNVIISTSLATYVFCTIIGFLITKKNLPFCIRFGATRNSFHLSVSLFLVLLSIGLAIINQTVTSFILTMKNQLTIEGIMIYEPAKLLMESPSWGSSILIDSIIIFLVLTIGYFLGSIVYRFGQLGGIITLTSVLLINFLPFIQDGLKVFVKGFANGEMGVNFLLLMILSLILLFINSFIIKTASPTPAIAR